MRTPLSLLALTLSLLSAPGAMALSEFGIEGMGVVSTRANEAQATISPDGKRIVWASDRPGGAGGWDLWQATLRDGRWQDPAPLAVNTPGDETDPYFSHDGSTLLFASNRPGGRGGFDLYQVTERADEGFGPVTALPDTINTRADERRPALRAEGQALLFARNGKGGQGGFDLFVATAQGREFSAATPLPAPLNSVADELGGDWLGNDGALALTRVVGGHSQVWVVGCDYAQAAVPVALSFNTADGQTGAPVVDASKPSELVLAGQARSPKAGGMDLYRMRAPVVTGCR
ncbi:PD40 domain-containing protein [Stenotrophomonas sp. ISL-67]|uniref:TolB family protein n=1 Tax=Stenotrophomonas sp. ISL-67 TaxID=2819171 RepID=UPI001BE67EF5|nr:PD40 domain-containing protein [Stenotrophomonas sp. ISL-67]MBT2767108.1 PD40 domain-containing protein [Stenotrophomonas sp. ISL-67]